MFHQVMSKVLLCYSEMVITGFDILWSESNYVGTVSIIACHQHPEHGHSDISLDSIIHVEQHQELDQGSTFRRRNL